MTPKVLAIDVTGPGGGAALLTPQELKVAVAPAEVKRARNLVPSIEGLLKDARLDLADLDLVACGVGPGSFTGIRIGIATAAALAHSAGLPVLDVGSLHSIAANAPESARRVLVALNARAGRVYAALFERGPKLIGQYRHEPPELIARELEESTWVLGDGRASYTKIFQPFPGFSHAPLHPGVVARLAAKRFEAGERKKPEELKPLYLRLSDPELRRFS
ncbi:MAG: tRNA (adenosine(37)-N6)-threonylcarbamoyltransferase complex dimerization subunit type 1 TsaB [Planctomycetota bacterium]